MHFLEDFGGEGLGNSINQGREDVSLGDVGNAVLVRVQMKGEKTYW